MVKLSRITLPGSRLLVVASNESDRFTTDAPGAADSAIEMPTARSIAGDHSILYIRFVQLALPGRSGGAGPTPGRRVRPVAEKTSGCGSKQPTRPAPKGFLSASAPSGRFHQPRMRAEAFRGRRLRARLELRVATIALHEPRLTPIAKVDVQNFPKPFAQLASCDRRRS